MIENSCKRLFASGLPEPVGSRRVNCAVHGGPFKSPFAGNPIVWVAGRDAAGGNNTDWQAAGTTTVK